jgi:hypothetical protein
MYNAIGDPVAQAQQARIYQRAAAGLLSCLVLVFVYPFYPVISGIDLSAPAELQTENKTIYYLQWVVPMLCVGIALIFRKSHSFFTSPLCCCSTAHFAFCRPRGLKIPMYRSSLLVECRCTLLRLPRFVKC